LLPFIYDILRDYKDYKGGIFKIFGAQKRWRWQAQEIAMKEIVKKHHRGFDKKLFLLRKSCQNKDARNTFG
jgi:hypothetical protein